jgi:hypothetical protein
MNYLIYPRPIISSSVSAYERLANILFFLLFFCFHLIQIRIGPLDSTTRPYVLILLIPILFYGATTSRHSILLKGMKGWAPFLFVCVVYSLYSIAQGIEIKSIIQPLIGFVSIFLFYCVGYSSLFLRRDKFARIIIYTYIPLLIFGFIESVGILLLSPIAEILFILRNNILTANMSATRLHLLFSEPSFIATFILFGFYLSTKIQTNLKRNLWLATLVFFLFMSASLSAAVVAIGSFGLKYLRTRKQVVLTVLLIPFLAVLFINISGRQLSLDDPSNYIRFLHLNALISMFYDSFGFGMGLGSFSMYFVKFLATINLAYIPQEIQGNISGETVATPYSVIFRIIGEMGLIGLFGFLFIFKRLFSGKRSLRPYYFGILLAGVSALPLGLPYAWLLLGLIDRENDS